MCGPLLKDSVVITWTSKQKLIIEQLAHVNATTESRGSGAAQQIPILVFQWFSKPMAYQRNENPKFGKAKLLS